LTAFNGQLLQGSPALHPNVVGDPKLSINHPNLQGYLEAAGLAVHALLALSFCFSSTFFVLCQLHRIKTLVAFVVL